MASLALVLQSQDIKFRLRNVNSTPQANTPSARQAQAQLLVSYMPLALGRARAVPSRHIRSIYERRQHRRGGAQPQF